MRLLEQRTVLVAVMALAWPIHSPASEPTLGRVTPCIIEDSELLLQPGQTCWQKFDEAAYSSLSAASRTFKKAVCEYHRASSAAQQLERNIEAVQEVQVSGLTVAEQELATFMEGLLYCRLAQVALDEQHSGEHGSLNHNDFCTSRRRAIASFANVDWAMARFDYEVTSQRTVYQLIDEMVACYSSPPAMGPLNEGLHAQCGIAQGITTKQREAIVTEVAEEAFVKHFDGGSAPITAMFQRKKEMSEKVEQNTEQEATALSNLAVQQVRPVYDALRNHFDTGIRVHADPMLEQYKRAYALAVAVQDTFNHWKGGLLLDKENFNHDYQAVLAGPGGVHESLSAEIERLAGDDGMIAKAHEISAIISNLAQKEEKTRAEIGQLCKVFYCQVAANIDDAFSPSWTPYDFACMSPLGDSNALCYPEDTPLSSELDPEFQFDPILVADLCADAGFSMEEFGLLWMSDAESRECFARD